MKTSGRKTYLKNTVCKLHYINFFRIQISKFSIQLWKHISQNFTGMTLTLSEKNCNINTRAQKNDIIANIRLKLYAV